MHTGGLEKFILEAQELLDNQSYFFSRMGC